MLRAVQREREPEDAGWCRWGRCWYLSLSHDAGLSEKGSLRKGQPLGSPQPSCVSSFLRVRSSNIHCSRARRTGAYHPRAGGGGGAGRGRRRMLRRRLRIREPSEKARRSLLRSPFLVPCPLPGIGQHGAAGQRKWMGPRGREEAGDSVTPDQLMLPLPAGNQSWVSGPHLSTISATDRLRPRLCRVPPPRLNAAFISVSNPNSPFFVCISSSTAEWESPGRLVCRLLLTGPLGPKFLWALGKPGSQVSLPWFFSPVKWEQ